LVRFQFDNSRYWNSTIPLRYPQWNILDLAPVQEGAQSEILDSTEYLGQYPWPACCLVEKWSKTIDVKYQLETKHAECTCCGTQGILLHSAQVSSLCSILIGWALKKENEWKDKEYSLHVHLIIAEVGIVQRHQKKIQAESLSSLVCWYSRDYLTGIRHQLDLVAHHYLSCAKMAVNWRAWSYWVPVTVEWDNIKNVFGMSWGCHVLHNCFI